ncbi:hypothetical protein WT12_07045 [Burkholderia territorii]|nr:hypothetical protein WT00_05265 [Burkholderia territorii]KVN49032.1 hypothetical protein WT12_07045 [Burkholderia territorii]
MPERIALLPVCDPMHARWRVSIVASFAIVGYRSDAQLIVVPTRRRVGFGQVRRSEPATTVIVRLAHAQCFRPAAHGCGCIELNLLAMPGNPQTFHIDLRQKQARIR